MTTTEQIEGAAGTIAGKIRAATWDIRDHYSDARTPARPINEGKRGGSALPDPLPAHVVDARREAHADLLHYTRAIQFTVVGVDGQHIRTRVDGHDPFELAGFIDRWAGVFAAQVPAEAAACARDLAGHAAMLKAIAAGPQVVRIDVGLCPEFGTSDMGERVPCGGGLRAVFRLTDEGRKSDGIACTVDPEHAWSTREWLMLGSRVREQKTGGYETMDA